MKSNDYKQILEAFPDAKLVSVEKEKKNEWFFQSFGTGKKYAE